MLLAHQLVVLITVLGFAATFGGLLTQLRPRDPEIGMTTLVGGWIQLIGWIALSLWRLVGLAPHTGPSGSYAAPIVITVIALLQLILLAKNRRFTSVPRGLLLIMIVMSLAAVTLALLWS